MSSRVKYSETREKIRECAIELFKKYGFENVTVVQICEAAGVTKRTFYYHYDSKEELVSGITDSLGVKAEQLLNTLVSQKDNVGMIWSLMSDYSINAMKYGPNVIKQIYVTMLKNGEESKFPESTYLFETVERMIGNAQNSGEIKNPCPPRDIAFTIYHAFRSATITWAAENGSFDLVGTFKLVFDSILGITDKGGEQG